MSEASVDELKNAVQDRLICKAWFKEAVPVREVFDGETVWDGVVHVFDLDYNGNVDRAYAWSRRMPDGKRKFFVIEHKGPIMSPKDAVRAAIAAETM